MLLRDDTQLESRSHQITVNKGDEVDVVPGRPCGADFYLTDTIAGFVMLRGIEHAAFRAASGGLWTAPTSFCRPARHLNQGRP